jgi:hypothetical protein
MGVSSEKDAQQHQRDPKNATRSEKNGFGAGDEHDEAFGPEVIHTRLISAIR